MDQKEINSIKTEILEQAQLAMKQAVEQQDAAMVGAIAAFLRSIDI